MNNLLINRNILLVRIITFFNAFSKLFSPIQTIFFLSLGFDLAKVGILLSVVWGSSFLLEIPTGVLSDKIGRKLTTIASNVCLTVSIFIYLVFSSFEIFLVAGILYGAHKAFRSGSNTSILFDSLSKLKRESEFKKIKSKYFADNRAAFLITGLFVGFLAVISFKLVFLVAFLAALISLGASILIKDIGSRTKLSSTTHFLEVLKLVLKNKDLSMTIAYFAILAAFLEMQKFDQAYYQFVGLPLSLFGVFFAITQVAQFLISSHVEKVEEVVSEKVALLVLPFVLAFLYLLLYLHVSIVSLVIFVLVGVLYAYRYTVEEFAINKFATPENRSTLLSVSGFFDALSISIAAVFLGFIGNTYSVPTIYLASAIVIVIFASYPAYYLWKKT